MVVPYSLGSITRPGSMGMISAVWHPFEIYGANIYSILQFTSLKAFFNTKEVESTFKNLKKIMIDKL